MAGLTEHKWNDSFTRGRMFEEHFREIFQAKGMMVIAVAKDLQDLGIDFLMTGRSGKRMSVELKSDERATETGNAFLELVSMSSSDGWPDKPGWMYTSIAQVLAYYLPLDGRVLFLDMADLKLSLGDFVGRYSIRHTSNGWYRSKGVVMPLKDLERRAFEIHTVEPYREYGCN